MCKEKHRRTKELRLAPGGNIDCPLVAAIQNNVIKYNGEPNRFTTRLHIYPSQTAYQPIPRMVSIIGVKTRIRSECWEAFHISFFHFTHTQTCLHTGQSSEDRVSEFPASFVMSDAPSQSKNLGSEKQSCVSEYQRIVDSAFPSLWRECHQLECSTGTATSEGSCYRGDCAKSHKENVQCVQVLTKNL